MIANCVHTRAPMKQHTAASSEAWAKLRDWASVAGRAGCYSKAALLMPLSKPPYVNNNNSIVAPIGGFDFGEFLGTKC